MLIDLAFNPFDASVPDMASLAIAAEARGVGCVWIADHFSGAVVGRRWSRDPFVCLSAIAMATERVDIGVLVANVVNRHPAQLASSVNSLQSIAPGRVRLGVGSGSAPGSRFAVEHDAIGRPLGAAEERRRRLVESIGALHAIWDRRADFETEVDEVGFSGLTSIVDDAPRPPLIVGASAWPTVEVALSHAAGVNLRRTAHLPELLERLQQKRPPDFEVSVLDGFDEVADEPHRIAHYEASGVDRLVLGISPPHHADRLDALDVSRG